MEAYALETAAWSDQDLILFDALRVARTFDDSTYVLIS
jgi:hypothetical protein